MKHALLTLIGAWLIGTVGFAQTSVSGTIIGQTWSMAGSPYHMVDDILVASLTIEPGVTIEAQGDFVFEVAGVLNSVGTAEAPITFQASDTTSGWQGIYFNYSSPGSIMVHCDVSGSTNSGIRIDNAQPEVVACTIHDNQALVGGGINVIGGSRFELTDCQVFSNLATGGNNREGGGLHVICDSVWITSCTIHRNHVVSEESASNGTAWAKGGGLYLTTTYAEISCTTVNDNRCSGYGTGAFTNASSWGGGILAIGDTRLYNTVTHNDTVYSQGAGDATSNAGGIYLEGHAEVINCVSDHNVQLTYDGFFGGPTRWGGGILGYLDSTSKVVNSTIAFNADADGISNWTDTLPVINTIVWENDTLNIHDQVSGYVACSFSDVQDEVAGVGNINYNPIFLSDSTLIIVPGSACIDAGWSDGSIDDACFPNSLGTPANDMGAHGGPGACMCPCFMAFWVYDVQVIPVTDLGNDGIISLTVVGSLPPYSVAWSGPDDFISNDFELTGLLPGSYQFILSGVECHQASGTVVVETSTGIDSPICTTLGGLIYPNPFSLVCSIPLPSRVTDRIDIFNSQGVLVRSFDHPKATTFIWNGRYSHGTEVPPGMYLVTVIADGQRYTQRVIKQ